MNRSLTVLAVALTMSAGCITRLPQRQQPQAGAGQLPPQQPVPVGNARIFLDAQDGPTIVTELMDRGRMGERVVCTTPCYTDMLLGEHVLRYRQVSDPRRTEKVSLTVVTRDRITGYRRAVGLYEAKLGRKIGGMVGVYGGAVVGLAGLFTYAIIAAFDGDGGDYTVPNVLMISGAAGIGIGTYLLVTGKTVVQQGAGSRWEF